MQRGWVVKYKDGEVISEWDFNESFRFLPRQQDIQAVALYWDGKYWVFPDKRHYFETKRGCLMFGRPNPSGAFSIVSRSIGYWEENKKVTWTLDETTGELSEPQIEEF
jgi:hypothetical protein